MTTRATTRKKTSKATKKPTTKKARPTRKPAQAVPVWTLAGQGQACGLHVDNAEVWAGWPNGDVVACDHDGKVLRRWKLPAGCNALVADEVWRYAGCDDGNVYDLTGRAPRVAYEIGKDARVLWIDVCRGRLVAADSEGRLSAFDVEQRPLFQHDPSASDGWMARADGSGCYLGNSVGITALDWNGAVRWHVPSECVGFGVIDRDGDLVVYVGDHEDAELLRIGKADGTVKGRGSCFSKAPHYERAHNAASCAAGEDVDYGATCNTLFAFNRAGKKVLEVATTSVGSPCSMAFEDGKLFVVTHTGVLARFDTDALGTETDTKTRAAKLSSMKVSRRDLEEGTEDEGVVVECVAHGGKLRVRVVSDGYRADWFCQFPRDIRVAGARYVVDGVREGDGFYRVFGDIKRLR